MTKRKTSKDYRKELQEFKDKKIRCENQIIARVKELIEKYPNVHMGDIDYANAPKASVFTRDYLRGIEKHGMKTLFEIMEAIEAHIAALHPHKQVVMDFETLPSGKILVVDPMNLNCGLLPTPDPICNCDKRDAPVYEEDGKYWCPQCGYEVQ